MEMFRYALLMRKVFISFGTFLLVSCYDCGYNKETNVEKGEIFIRSYSLKGCDYDSTNFVVGEQFDSLMNTFLEKFLEEHKTYYVVVDNDSIVALFTRKELNDIVDAMSSISSKDLREKCPIKSIMQINTLYRCFQNLERGKTLSKFDYTPIKHLADTTMAFFPKYLLSQIYRELDKEKAVELYAELLNDTVNFSRKKYAEEYIELITSKNRLIVIENQYIPFIEYEHDFGKMDVGESQDCVFYYTNKSDYKYIIYNVTTSCGCTVPEWNAMPLNPNCSDSIVVKFEANKKGFARKQIVINGNTERRITLNIKAIVE